MLNDKEFLVHKPLSSDYHIKQLFLSIKVITTKELFQFFQEIHFQNDNPQFKLQRI